MVIEIVQIKEKARYEVNGKLIYKNQFGNWQTHNILLPMEIEAFNKLVASRFKDQLVKKNLITAN